jgi:anti-sigma-K factor RskA
MSERDHDQFRELLGAYALDALDTEERTAVEDHLAQCVECADEVAAHRKALQALPPSAPAPENAWKRVEARIQSERLRPAEARHRANASIGSLAILSGRRWLAGAAAVAAAVALTLIVFNATRSDEPSVQAQIVATSTESTVAGEVRLFEPHSDEGRIVLDLSGLPQSPAEHHYQVWVLRAEGGGAMEAIGAFSPGSGTSRLELPLPGPGDYAAVDISVQEDGGSPEHSGLSIAGATLTWTTP